MVRWWNAMGHLVSLVTAQTISALKTFSAGITLSSNSHLTLPSHNDATTPTLTFGDGDSGIYETADDRIAFSIAGTKVWEWRADEFRGMTQAFTALIVPEASSATNPVFCFTDDLDTGLGRSTANQLSLVAGGTEGVNVSSSLVTHQLPTVLAGSIKGTTGDPGSPVEGQITINTFDNVIKIYADGAWHEIVTWV